MFIECSKCPYAYRNLKTLETLDDSLSPGTKLLFTFLSLRFFNMRERETQFLTLLTFPSDPTTCGSPKQTTGLASASSGKSTCFVQAQISNNCFFFKSPNPQPIASGHDIIHIPSFISYLFFFIVTSVIATSSPHAREHLHSMCAPN